MSNRTALTRFVTNDISDFDLQRPYSVMLGLNPSTGAKSPHLWNRLISDFSSMYCLDIPDETSFKSVFTHLQDDPYCLGGAITSPYKEYAYTLCPDSTPVCSLVRATNNFSRSRNHNYFRADNTDAIGFLKSSAESFPLDSFSNVLIIGNGGVSRAIQSSILTFSSLPIYVTTSRQTSSTSRVTYINTSNLESFLQLSPTYSNTLLVQATPLGDYTNPYASPLDSLPLLYKLIQTFSPTHLFEAIHTPAQTRFSSQLQIPFTNGHRMSIYQAVSGFTNVYPSFDESTVKVKMSST